MMRGALVCVVLFIALVSAQEHRYANFLGATDAKTTGKTVTCNGHSCPNGFSAAKGLFLFCCFFCFFVVLFLLLFLLLFLSLSFFISPNTNHQKKTNKKKKKSLFPKGICVAEYGENARVCTADDLAIIAQGPDNLFHTVEKGGMKGEKGRKGEDYWI